MRLDVNPPAVLNFTGANLRRGSVSDFGLCNSQVATGAFQFVPYAPIVRKFTDYIPGGNNPNRQSVSLFPKGYFARRAFTERDFLKSQGDSGALTIVRPFPDIYRFSPGLVTRSRKSRSLVRYNRGLGSRPFIFSFNVWLRHLCISNNHDCWPRPLKQLFKNSHEANLLRKAPKND